MLFKNKLPHFDNNQVSFFFFQSESKKQLILNKGEKGRKKEGKREEGEEKGRERGKKNSPISTSE